MGKISLRGSRPLSCTSVQSERGGEESEIAAYKADEALRRVNHVSGNSRGTNASTMKCGAHVYTCFRRTV